MVSPKLPELAGVIVEASAWSLVVFIYPDSPFSQSGVPSPEREQAELGGRSCCSNLQKRFTHIGLWCGLIRYQWLNCSTFRANVNL
ncbi:hypothetical protein [Ktedonobacter racemifer]|uniref:Uncharacterized protein n=1 Tax=Ktedonobacter racemifer DSM 44963 TaxID=485913 RepID=D6TY75_KTERA|nr:hypothetical protein [Ktedonobacter racemifer]EFH85071.1 hypothetical protein Krac_6222 [Ktedonobacter racemifer DSM 44963]